MSSAVTIVRDVTSVNGAAAVSTPVRVAGQLVGFQSVAPSALVTIQISDDGQNWVTGTNLENVDLGTTLQSLTEELKERPEWVRVSVATDAGGPQLYRVLFHVKKDNQ